MSVQDFRKDMEIRAKNAVKSVNTDTYRCRWCMAGPFSSYGLLQSHYERCVLRANAGCCS
jgi:hypothetical protein